MGEPGAAVDLSTEGYTEVRHPGTSFRPVPTFTFDIPPGWVVDEFPESLCVVATPATDEGPWSNVFLQHERVLRTTALEDVALHSWEAHVAKFPGAELVDERLLELEQWHYVRESEHTLLGERVTRIDSHWFGPDVDHATVDLFRLIGLHPVVAGDDRTIEYVKILASFRFD